MSRLLDKMMNLVGWEEEEYIEEDELQGHVEAVLPENKKNRNKVVNIHSSGNFKVVILQPESFEKARDITEHLKNRKPVVVNVEGLEKNHAQRIVDFLSGSVYALNGNIQRVSQGIFLIAPQNVDILGGAKERVDEKGEFPWLK